LGPPHKSGAIEPFEVLRRSHDFFKRSLSGPNAKLMVIGYSFQDEHINDVIVEASSRHGLGTYIVDPSGRRVLQDPKAAHAQIMGHSRIVQPRPVEGIKLIGEVRRPLPAIFGGKDKFAFRELMRFFQ
jgi:hypothetical protein